MRVQRAHKSRGENFPTFSDHKIYMVGVGPRRAVQFCSSSLVWQAKKAAAEKKAAEEAEKVRSSLALDGCGLRRTASDTCSCRTRHLLILDRRSLVHMHCVFPSLRIPSPPSLFPPSPLPLPSLSPQLTLMRAPNQPTRGSIAGPHSSAHMDRIRGVYLDALRKQKQQRLSNDRLERTNSECRSCC